MIINSDFLSHDGPGDLDDGGGAARYRDRAPGRDCHSRDPGEQEAQEAPQPRRLQQLSPGWLWVWESQSKKILRIGWMFQSVGDSIQFFFNLLLMFY